MKACGLIVEYNPFHYGHLYHIQEAKKISKADCLIAVMSGNFLQRGEPAIVDKFHRTKAALYAGIDLVLELPYRYAVQSSALFSQGSILTLANIGVDAICFGSEAGRIDPFLDAYEQIQRKQDKIQPILQSFLKKGYSYPRAFSAAYKKVIGHSLAIDLTKPNNILGFSYVQAIFNHHLAIKPYTIQRKESDFHDQAIKGTISSATSIRKKLLKKNSISTQLQRTMPKQMVHLLNTYKKRTNLWHSWEKYFPLLYYRIMTMETDELKEIKGVDEGLENRIKKTARTATSFKKWMDSIKTKRYTWTRLQRMFVHILTNTKKYEYEEKLSIPHLRILGMSDQGRKYLRLHKKNIKVPVISQLRRDPNKMLKMDERATNAYYSILDPKKIHQMRKQEFLPPILNEN